MCLGACVYALAQFSGGKMHQFFSIRFSKGTPKDEEPLIGPGPEPVLCKLRG